MYETVNLFSERHKQVKINLSFKNIFFDLIKKNRNSGEKRLPYYHREILKYRSLQSFVEDTRSLL